MKKRIFGIVLCLIMVLSLIPASAFAAGYKAGDIAGTTGAGTENDPVVCDTFAELKAAMENTNIVFIKLGGADDIIPRSSVLSAAIRVSSRKVLTVTGNNVFTSPLNGNNDCLIDLTSNLEIKGTGILQYTHGNSGGSGAIVRVEAAGNLTISERPALLGRANGNVFGRALFLYGGVTNISGGRFEGYSASPNSAGIDAVYICNDATLTVKDGTFSSSKHSSASAEIEMSGLSVYDSPTVSLMGGTFYGVRSSVSLDSLLGTNYAYQNYANGPAVDMNGVYNTTDTLIVFDATEYLVTFQANGHGKRPTEQAVISGQKATRPEDPTAVGWTFDGWYLDETCNTEFDFNTPITGAIPEMDALGVLRLWAKWEENAPAFLKGDVNGDGVVTDADAVYLLYHTFFGDAGYPVNQPCDFNGDGAVTDADAVYLLYYTFFGEESYPLH